MAKGKKGSNNKAKKYHNNNNNKYARYDIINKAIEQIIINNYYKNYKIFLHNKFSY